MNEELYLKRNVRFCKIAQRSMDSRKGSAVGKRGRGPEEVKGEWRVRRNGAEALRNIGVTRVCQKGGI